MTAISPNDALAPAPPGGGGFVTRYKRELSVLAAYLALLLLMAIARPTFFQAQFAATWVSAAPILVAAVGMTLVILARHIDISIGSQLSICAVLAGLLAKAGLPMPIVALAMIAAGALMGAINGALVAFAGLPSIVVTLATMVVLREGLRWGREGEAIHNLPAGFQWLGLSQLSGQIAIVLVALAVFGLFAFAMRYLAAGRAVYAVGSDLEAARLAGVRPRRVVFTVFVVMGALVGLAAMLRAVRFAQVDPNIGLRVELQVIAAVVVGGTTVSGGRGTLLGSLIGVALLGTIASALAFLDVPPQWEQAIQGLIILLAAAADGLFRAGRRGKE